MAGAVRQPIDIPSLERYISKHVPEITIPIDVKQVTFSWPLQVNPTLTFLPVRLWPIQPHLPSYLLLRPQICDAQEATRKVDL